MRKAICAIFLMIICIMYVPTTAFAGTRIIGDYDVGSNKTIHVNDIDMTYVFAYKSKMKDNEDYPVPRIEQDRKPMDGKLTYPNYDSSKLGSFVLEWVFTPSDKSYEPITGTANAIVVMPSWGTMRDENDDVSIPSFQASSISMQIGSSYYPQISNNIESSDYLWKSSDKSIVTVNKKTGKLIAKSNGEAIITCKIDTPYDESYTISIKVVAQSNASEERKELTATNGDIFNISAEQGTTISTSRYASSKNSVASVDQFSGLITARSDGEAYITCTTVDLNYNIVVERYHITVTE